MGNCLVKKLKSVIENDNLKVLGRFYIKSTAGNNRFGSFTFATTWHIEGNGYFSDSTYTQNLGNSIDVSANAFFYYVAIGEVTLWCDDNYQINSINDNKKKMTLDWEMMEYRPRTGQISVYDTVNDIKGSGKLKDVIDVYISGTVYGIIDLETFVGNTAIQRFFITGNSFGLRGNIASFANANLTRFTLFNNINVYGNISALSKSVSCTDITCYSTSIGGTIESLVEGQWSNNRRSGTIAMSPAFTNIKLNGNAVDFGVNITFSANDVVIKKTDNTTIATYNGSTWTYPA